MTQVNIPVQSRTNSGKGVARQLRREGKIPGVLYAPGSEPLALAVDAHALKMAMQAGHFYTTKQTLDLDGKQTEALARDVQRDPVRGDIIHIDFMRYDPARVVRVTVPVVVTDELDSPGLKKGGVLQLVRSEVEFLCRADSIPGEIIVSMAGKDIGDAAKISEVTLPDGVRPTIERDFTIATVVGTRTSTMADLDAGKDGEAAEGDAEGGEEATEASEE